MEASTCARCGKPLKNNLYLARPTEERRQRTGQGIAQ